MIDRLVAIFRRGRIQVTLNAHGPAARYLHAGTYELGQGDTVQTLLGRAGLSTTVDSLTILIRGTRVPPVHRLADGDEVTVVQFAAGG